MVISQDLEIFMGIFMGLRDGILVFFDGMI